MRMMKMGVAAAALICSSLAWPGRAAATDMAVAQGQCDEMVESAAEPAADGALETVGGWPVDLGVAGADVPTLMSQQPLARPLDPSPSARRSCDIYCCYCVNDPFGIFGFYVCCFEGFCAPTGVC